MEVPDRPLDPAYRIHVLGDTDAVTADDVLALWAREAGVPGPEAQRRIHEVLLVATVASTGTLVGVSTTALRRVPRLGMDLWYFRAFVSDGHRMSNVAVQLLDRVRALLEERFVSGEDTRGAGVLIDVQHEGLKRSQPRAVWPQTGFAFIGENERGDHQRVRYFPGALAPAPV